MMKRILALSCGICLLTAISGCPCNYYTGKAGTTHIANAQPPVKQAVVAQLKPVGL